MTLRLYIELYADNEHIIIKNTLVLLIYQYEI
jgi:hypothetical protein